MRRGSIATTPSSRPDGRRFTDAKDLLPFGLQRNYWGNPARRRRRFQTGADGGRLRQGRHRRQQVIDEVAARLKQFPEWEYVEVEQRVVGADGRIITSASWLSISGA